MQSTGVHITIRCKLSAACCVSISLACVSISQAEPVQRRCDSWQVQWLAERACLRRSDCFGIVEHQLQTVAVCCCDLFPQL
jgi:hypothetical protein